MPETSPHTMYRNEPVILLTFANDRYEPDAGYLRNLVAERRAIEKALADDGKQRRYTVVVEQNLTHARLDELIAEHRDAIIGFHYGGHADSVGLHLEDDLGRPDTIVAKAIAEKLTVLPRLRWVFLNGCSTRPHLDALHTHLTVPVVATDCAIRDDQAQRFATALYEALVDGSNLAEAFDRAESLGKASRELSDLLDERAETRMMRPAGHRVGHRWPWALLPHAKAPDATGWTLAGELGMYGIAGRLAQPQRVKLPRNAVSQLLVARHEVVPFAGREAELAELDTWADDAEPIRVRLIHGPGGSGKTRLLVEWIKRRAERELAGFLHGSIDDDTTAAIAEARAATIVIDYAETRAGLFGVLSRLARRWSEEQPGRIRIVLLARNAGDWWASLKERSGDVGALLKDSPTPLDLPALVDEARRPLEFTRAAQAFAAKRKIAAPETAPDLADARFGRALYLHMAALAAVDGLELTADELITGLLDHEKRMWRTRAGIGPDDRDAADRFTRSTEAFMGAATLRGGFADRPRAEDIAAHFADDGAALVGFMRTIYGGEAAWVNPVEPDLLGEALVGSLLENRYWPEWLPTATSGVELTEAAHGFTVLGRIEAQAPEPARRSFATLLDTDFERRAQAAFVALLALGEETAHSALGAVLADALDKHGERALARRFDGRVPEQTTMLREVGVWTDTTLLAEGEGGLGHTPAEKARRFNNLGIRLSALGRREEALSATEEAVRVYRELAASRPDAFPPDLGTGLNNLGIRLSELGRQQQALSATEEAVRVFRDLATSRPDAFLPGLASSLNNLGIRLSELGRREEALSATEEAVRIRRELVASQPDAFLPDLAASLHSLGNRLSSLGRLEEALSTAEEAVRTYQELAAKRPDAFLPDLASSLHSLGNQLSSLGRREEALSTTEEVVRVRRELADSRPDAFLPGLAGSLNNLGADLSALGRREEALSAAKEAVRVYRKLAASRPDAFLPGLAGSLNNLGIRLSALGRREDALSATEEAVRVYRKLAASRPDAFLPDLAASLNNLGGALSALGQRKEALSATDEAVRIRRELAASHPDAFLPDLARSLNNLGTDLSALGRREEALSATEEAVSVYRELAASRPDAFLPDLARSLGLLGMLLLDADDMPGAGQATAEALDAIWSHLEATPAAHVDLAKFFLQQRLRSLGGEPDTALLERQQRLQALIGPQ